MKRFATLVVVMLCCAQMVCAQGLPISQLPAATRPLGGSEAVPMLQAAQTRQAPAAAFGIPIFSASAPVNPSNGQQWYNTTTTPYVLNVWDGTQWDAVATLDPSAHIWAASQQLIGNQTVTGASKAFGSSDFNKRTRRTCGSCVASMTDSLPPAGNLTDGQQIHVIDADTTWADTITAGSGTTILSGSSTSLNPGSELWLEYDASLTDWHPVANTGNIYRPPHGIRMTATTSTALSNQNCGAYLVGDSGADVVTLPAFPILNCAFTFEPFNTSILLNTNGQVFGMPGWGNHSVDQIYLPFTNKIGFLTIVYDGTQWDVGDHSAGLYSNVAPLDTPILANGQVYFSYDSGNNRFQLCQKNGPGGLIINGQMHAINSGCIYFGKNGTTSSALNYFYAVDAGLSTVTGAVNNGSGLVRLTVSSFLGLVPTAGDQVSMNCISINGTVEADGISLGTVIDSTHIDIIGSTFAHTFSASPHAACRIDFLAASTTGHVTSGGVEVFNGSSTATLVGMAWVGAANAVNDIPTKRDVASYYNRKTKTCINKYTADRTTTSLTYAEPNTEIECEFVTWGENDSPWSISGTFKNGTLSDGAAVSAGFDSATTAETEESGGVNTSGAAGIVYPFSVRGSKNGLSEGKHFGTALAKAITGGTVTILGTTPVTSLEINVQQ